jgi:outer membrane beta-barrel protein
MRLTSLAFALVVLLSPLCGIAQDKDAMQGAPVVRRAINWRSQRSELMPIVGTTINDAYFKNIVLGIGYNYYATNWLSFGATAAYALPIKTGLSDNIEQEKSVTIETDDTAGTGDSVPAAKASFSVPATHLGLIADAHVGIVPLYGKFLLLGDTAVAYDFHLTAGFGVIQVLWNSDLPGTFKADDEFRPAPVFGGGIRIFVDRGVAIGAEVLDYFATMQVVAERDPDRSASECLERPLDCYRVSSDMQWTHNIATMLTFSIFMPSDTSYEE